MDRFEAVGLGLDHSSVRLARTSADWLAVGSALRGDVADILTAARVSVEQIGSSSVLGLLAKPIVDLAAGLSADADLPRITSTLEAAQWTYRGDAGDDGGHVFVLETRPGHRVAHLHVVEHDGQQWAQYLRLRDLLRRSQAARDSYETVKLQLADQHRNDRPAYTAGKSEVVRALLAAGEHDVPTARCPSRPASAGGARGAGGQAGSRSADSSASSASGSTPSPTT